MNQRTQLTTTGDGRYRYARYQPRLTVAVMLSLSVHAFVLSLQLGLPGIGLPGLELPWNQRRAQPAGLSVVLSNARRADDAQSAPAAREPDNLGAPASEPVRTPQAGSLRVVMPPAPRAAEGSKAPTTASKARSGAKRSRSAPPMSRPRERTHPVQAASGPRLITQDNTGQNTFSVPLPVLDGPDRNAAPSPSIRPELAQSAMPDTVPPPSPVEQPVQEREPAHAAQAEEDAARRAHDAGLKAQQEQRTAQELAAQRQAEALAQQERQQREAEEAARRAQEMEAKHLAEQRLQDEARAERLAQEAQARRQAQEAEQQRAAALALQKLAEQQRLEEENARVARELEARKREELRQQEEARARALEQETRRQEQEAALRRRQAEELAAKERAEAEVRRQAEAAAARQREQALAEKGGAAETAAALRNAGTGSLASRALEQLRKGGELSGSAPMPHPPVPEAAADAARRRSILGRVDNDVGLMMYVESWRLKIERNGRLNYRQSLVDGAYTEPIVTVAVRSDGSIEDIIFHRSSGRPELDDAIRRIVRINARYAAFPPELARRFDVIEIRRVWNFDNSLKLLEHVR